MASVAQLFRHPIKSLGIEALRGTDVRAGECLPFDRVWAVAHEAAKLTDGWSPCSNFIRCAKSAGLMAVTAKVVDGSVALSHPDLPDITLDPDTQGEALIDWVRPICNPNRAAPAQIVRATGQAMTDVNYPSISILGTASLTALGQAAGRDLDPRRFRGNIWVDGTAPFEEFEWVGSTLTIGGIPFEIRERITRCVATNVDPATGRPDTNVLGTLDQRWGHTDFGVYAVALGSGRIAVGDAVSL